MCPVITINFIPDRPIPDRYRGGGGDSELLAAAADAGHRRGILRAAHLLPGLLAQHQAPRGCE